MSLSDRVLYHQLHPIKVFVDVAAPLVAIDLLSSHRLVLGLIVGIALPLLVSVTVMNDLDLEPYRRSGIGAYVRRFMPAWVQALRIFGAALACYAAWHHVPAGIVAGLALVAACWSSGIVIAVGRSVRAGSVERPLALFRSPAGAHLRHGAALRRGL